MALAQSDTNLYDRVRSIQRNMDLMRTYFDALFGKDLAPILDMIADDIEWTVVPTGDVLRGKQEIAKLAPNHWAASPDRVKTLVNLFASEEFASLEYVTSGTLKNQADFPSVSFAAPCP